MNCAYYLDAVTVCKFRRTRRGIRFKQLTYYDYDSIRGVQNHKLYKRLSHFSNMKIMKSLGEFFANRFQVTAYSITHMCVYS